jgi:ABC-type transport system involved in cytochrome bd biosynthesis fused ATPase/permease subunit
MDRVRTKSKLSRITPTAIIVAFALALISGGLMLANIDFSTHQGSTIVMVTHDPRFAERADRQVSLFDGKIVDDRRLRAVS